MGVGRNDAGGLFSMVYADRSEIVAWAPATSGLGPGFIEALPESFPTTGFAMDSEFLARRR